ncbi:hypothetical protein MPTK1_3g13230 [Marchantia polymorpha subsp. ruderalis]|uniref:Uncharacterized protein n=2 Tax=Marchantia polymorpha TaxID=3197 RepID=A0AAF6B0C4_MARPO|nr:hypothetical protein MARPO_0050s0115 [Marchantia polymorpha]BBN05458.1 hypothetical protein Mp_3g13230 [Marchantia polymorpha subsp. ruderalis]|eukprot:PTQ38671.1 hypothetical protein MARPO_0050s0115 [Marchantia polymorpha]
MLRAVLAEVVPGYGYTRALHGMGLPGPTQGKSFGLLWRWLNLQLPGPLKKCVGRAEGADRVKVPLSSCSEEPDDSLSEPHEK